MDATCAGVTLVTILWLFHLCNPVQLLVVFFFLFVCFFWFCVWSFFSCPSVCVSIWKFSLRWKFIIGLLSVSKQMGNRGKIRLLENLWCFSKLTDNFKILCTYSMPWKLNDCFVINKEVFSRQEAKIRDTLRLWFWRRLFRVPWTARRANQSILKATHSWPKGHCASALAIISSHKGQGAVCISGQCVGFHEPSKWLQLWHQK